MTGAGKESRMDWLRTAGSRLRDALLPARESEIDEELRFHVEMETEENLRRGMSPEQAAREAQKRFGSVAATKENYRDRKAIPLLTDLGRDLRYALRSLSRSPGFTLFAVLSLALGIGANTAIFSLFDTVLLRTLPVPEPQKLRVVGIASSQGPFYGFSHVAFRELREAAQGIADIAASSGSRDTDIRFLQDRGTGEAAAAERVSMQMVSGNFFAAIRIGASIGRVFTASDDMTPGAHPVAVVSHGFWRERFQQDPSVIGSQFQLNQTVFTVVGVAEPSFEGLEVGSAPVLWLPMAMQPQIEPGRNTLNSRNHSWMKLMARLLPESTEAALESVMAVQFKRSSEEEARSIDSAEIREAVLNRQIHLEPGAQGFSSARTMLSDPLLVLMGLAALVLLVACANVANLQLARSVARERELAVRISLGAGRFRVLRQLLTESGVLIAMGAVCGLFLAWGVRVWLTGVIARVADLDITTGIDFRLLLFTFGMALLLLAIVGLAPAWRPSRESMQSTLNDGGRSTTVSRRHFMARKALVLVQIAASVVLLTGATLLTRSLYNLLTMGTGFARENVIVIGMIPQLSGYALPGGAASEDPRRQSAEARLKQLYERLEDAVRGVPGVQAAGFSSCGFLNECEEGRCCMVIPGVELQGIEEKRIRGDKASPDFFRTSGVPLLLGRGFTEADTEKGAPMVGILNETAAREIFGDQNPIGREIGWESRPEATLRIVGVVGDSKYSDLREKTPRLLFQPFERWNSSFAMLYVRTSTSPSQAIPLIRAAMDRVEPNLRVSPARTAEQNLQRAVARERIVSEFCGVFTLLALVLAAVGLYGVMAFQVIRRTGEFGIRMALGARQGQILWSVLRESLAVAVAGIVLGTAVAYAATRSLSSLLYGVSAWDPATVIFAALVVAAVAGLAGFLPARRASSVDPAISLRYE